MIVKTSGGAKPILLRDKVENNLPDWSWNGDWITYRDDKGWNLISPDGKTSKFVGKIETAYLAFSKDGKLLYGIETGTDQNRATLFSLDLATLKQKVIKELGRDLEPAQYAGNPRFSVAPDGNPMGWGAVAFTAGSYRRTQSRSRTAAPLLARGERATPTRPGRQRVPSPTEMPQR